MERLNEYGFGETWLDMMYNLSSAIIYRHEDGDRYFRRNVMEHDYGDKIVRWEVMNTCFLLVSPNLMSTVDGWKKNIKKQLIVCADEENIDTDRCNRLFKDVCTDASEYDHDLCGSTVAAYRSDQTEMHPFKKFDQLSDDDIRKVKYPDPYHRMIWSHVGGGGIIPFVGVPGFNPVFRKSGDKLEKRIRIGCELRGLQSPTHSRLTLLSALDRLVDRVSLVLI
jgi:hypothetical protein